MSQELSTSNTKLFEEKTVSKEDQIEATATPAYKDELTGSNETSCKTVNRKTDKLERTKLEVQNRLNQINQKLKK